MSIEMKNRHACGLKWNVYYLAFVWPHSMALVGVRVKL